MKEIDLLFVVLGIVWGLLIGLLYFGGLWWTLLQLPDRVRPKLWLAGSYALRLAFALLGFWLIMRESLTALFLSLAGFFIAAYLTFVKYAFGLGLFSYRPALFTLSILLLVIGVQFLILGLLGEIIVWVYHGSDKQKTYYIERIYA